MGMAIAANDLKVRGVNLIDSVVEKNHSAITPVPGKEKYIVLKIDDYNRMRELELEAAIRESKADIEAGRFYTDGVAAHIERVMNV